MQNAPAGANAAFPVLSEACDQEPDSDAALSAADAALDAAEYANLVAFTREVFALVGAPTVGYDPKVWACRFAGVARAVDLANFHDDAPAVRALVVRAAGDGFRAGAFLVGDARRAEKEELRRRIKMERPQAEADVCERHGRIIKYLVDSAIAAKLQVSERTIRRLRTED